MTSPTPDPAQGPAPRPERNRHWRLAALLAFGVAGGLFVTTSLNADGLDLRESSVTDLDHVVRAERERVDNMQDEVATLTRDITALGKRVDDSQVERLLAEVEELKNPAGFAAVAGPGLTVTLDDAPRSVVERVRKTKEVLEDELVVHQQDIQAVVNALWAGGAEAITIKGQRIISTTGIKCVGNTVILHGLPYSPPYDIAAIGDAEELQAALDDNEYIAGFIAMAARFSLGYDVSRSARLEMPGFAGSPVLEHAEQGKAPVDRDS